MDIWDMGWENWELYDPGWPHVNVPSALWEAALGCVGHRERYVVRSPWQVPTVPAKMEGPDDGPVSPAASREMCGVK